MKIKVTFDTKSKQCEATVDGQPLIDMQNIYFSYCGKNEDGKPCYRMEMGKGKYDKENGVEQMEYTRAEDESSSLKDAAKALLGK